MKDTLHLFFIGFFAVIALGIIFVQAGAKSGIGGGEQTAAIINSAGNSLSHVAKSLETGS